MTMILIDHTIVNLNVPLKSFISQVTNSGVIVFIFLSAYLFGGKQITNYKQWYIKRIKRIMIPFWIFMIIDFILEAVIWDSFDWELIPVHAFGLQGIEGLGVVVGSIHLWYITLILILYLLTPAIQWISKKLGKKKILVLIPLAIVQVVTSYTIDWGLFSRPLSWCILALEVYLIGYWLGEIKILDKIGTREFWGSTIVMLASIVLVFAWRKFIGENTAYERIVQPYALVAVDWWICVVVSLVREWKLPDLVMRVVGLLDSISYEVYIVHGLVIAMGAMPVLNNYGTVAYMATVIIGTMVAAVVLHLLSEAVYKMMKKS